MKKMTKTELLKTNILREKTKLYFCGTSPDGFIIVGCSDMARGRAKKQDDKTK